MKNILIACLMVFCTVPLMAQVQTGIINYKKTAPATKVAPQTLTITAYELDNTTVYSTWTGTYPVPTLNNAQTVFPVTSFTNPGGKITFNGTLIHNGTVTFTVDLGGADKIIVITVIDNLNGQKTALSGQWSSVMRIGSAVVERDCIDTISQTAHGLTVPAYGYLPIHYNATGWVPAGFSQSDTTAHDAYLIEVLSANSIVIAYCGSIALPVGHGLSDGNYYYLQDGIPPAITADSCWHAAVGHVHDGLFTFDADFTVFNTCGASGVDTFAIEQRCFITTDQPAIDPFNPTQINVSRDFIEVWRYNSGRITIHNRNTPDVITSISQAAYDNILATWPETTCGVDSLPCGFVDPKQKRCYSTTVVGGTLAFAAPDQSRVQFFNGNMVRVKLTDLTVYNNFKAAINACLNVGANPVVNFVDLLAVTHTFTITSYGVESTSPGFFDIVFQIEPNGDTFFDRFVSMDTECGNAGAVTVEVCKYVPCDDHGLWNSGQWWNGFRLLNLTEIVTLDTCVTSSAGNNLLADNGIRIENDVILLGDTLIENTNITQNDFSFNLRKTVGGTNNFLDSWINTGQVRLYSNPSFTHRQDIAMNSVWLRIDAVGFGGTDWFINHNSITTNVDDGAGNSSKNNIFPNSGQLETTNGTTTGAVRTEANKVTLAALNGVVLVNGTERKRVIDVSGNFTIQKGMNTVMASGANITCTLPSATLEDGQVHNVCNTNDAFSTTVSAGGVVPVGTGTSQVVPEGGCCEFTYNQSLNIWYASCIDAAASALQSSVNLQDNAASSDALQWNLNEDATDDFNIMYNGNTWFSIDGATGKVTMPGVLDPPAIIYTPTDTAAVIAGYPVTKGTTVYRTDNTEWKYNGNYWEPRGGGVTDENVIYSKNGSNFNTVLSELTKGATTISQYLLENPKNSLIVNLTDASVSEFVLQTALSIPTLTVSVKSLAGVETAYTFFDPVPTDLYIVSFPTATSILFESIKEAQVASAENVIYNRAGAFALAMSASTKNNNQNIAQHLLADSKNFLIYNLLDTNISETTLRTLFGIPTLTVQVRNGGTTTPFTGTTAIPTGFYAINLPTATSIFFDVISSPNEFGWSGDLFTGISTYEVNKGTAEVYVKALDANGEAGVQALSVGDAVAVLYQTDGNGTNQVKTDINGIELLFKDDKPLLIGNNTDPSLAGTAGQVITSQGDNLPPVWASVASSATVQTVTSTSSITEWNSIVYVNAISGNIVLTLPTTVSQAGKSISIIRTDATANTVTLAPFAGQTLSLLNSGGEIFQSKGGLTVTANGTVATQVSNIGTAPVSTTFGRVNASSNLPNTTFVSTGVGTKILFNAIVNSKGTSFSGTDGIVPSAPGRYRCSFFVLAASGEFVGDGTFHVVQNGVSVGSVFVNVMEAAGVNQTFSFIDADLVASQPVSLHYQPLANDAVIWERGSYFDLSQTSGFLPVIGQTIDRLYARQTTTQGGPTVGTVINLEQKVSGNIIFSSNTATLEAGKTYYLEGSGAIMAGGSSAYGTRFFNVTTGQLFGESSYAISPNNANTATFVSRNAIAEITPAVTTQVQLRVDLIAGSVGIIGGSNLVNGGVGAGSSQDPNGASWIRITQINPTGFSILPIANGGTGSSTQNFVDLTTNQTAIGGTKNFTSTVGIGTPSPIDKLHITGTDASINGPHVRYTSSLDAFPIRQDLNYTHNGAYINFDGYFDGAFKHSTAAGRAYSIYKNSSGLNIIGSAANSTGTGSAWAQQFGASFRYGGVTANAMELAITSSISANRKIVLWDNTAPNITGSLSDHEFLGFGVSGGILRYQVSTGDSHVFYVGTSPTTSTELMRITGAGTVGVATPSPTSTFHVTGSQAGSVTSTNAAAYTALATNHTIILSLLGFQAVTLPAANTCPGREYIIINQRITANKSISSYTNLSGSISALIPQESELILKSDGTSWIQIGGRNLGEKIPITQIFTASGTYTPTQGMRYCEIKVVGGGGGGAGAGAGAVGTIGFATGGGAGGEAEVRLTAAQIGASQAVTIGGAGTAGAAGANAGGAGGTTSLGALVSCTGGLGGNINGVQAGPHAAVGGLGGTATVSTGIALRTKNGDAGSFAFAGIFSGLGSGASGQGASSTFGAGGNAVRIFNPTTGALGGPGLAASGRGSGGSGAISAGTGSVAQAGGAGTAGQIIITEYF